ncbi:MAG: ABC transporter permease, partial [Acidobacteriota bacterium]|nr:ABC transporter permease [Acidobacteriota bacterium]
SELRFHLEQRTADLIANGVAPAEARRRAMLDFGGVERVKEECREARGTYLVESLSQDIGYALRTLRKSPAFAAIAVLTLALGIGASTVIFSALYGVLLNTFPFPHPNRVISFGVLDLDHPKIGDRESLSFPEFLYFREHNSVFEDMSGEYGGFGTTPVRYTTGDSTYQFDADYLTVNSFQLFGENPILGRLPTAEDVKPGATRVFVIGYKLWQRQFDGDPKIVGRSFTLNGVPRILVGIMPPRFRWAWVDVWIPISVEPAQVLTDPELKDRFLYTVGRLKTGIALKQAAADLDVVAHQYAKVDPRLYPKRFTVVTTTLADRVTGGFKQLIYPLFYASLMLLLIACSNVASLLLARTTNRDKEIAIRASLGATPGRLIRQFLTESFVLGGVGCLAGCFLAWVGIRDIVPLVPYNTFPQEAVIALNPPVLAFAAGITFLITVAIGLAPALGASRARFQSRLMAAGRGADTGFRHGWLRALLVVSEVALSIVLLIGSGLLLRTVFGLERVDLGFNPRNLLAFQVSYPAGVQRAAGQERALIPEVLRRIQALPGVVAATEFVSSPPYGAPSSEITIPGKTHASPWNSLLDLGGKGYFSAFQSHLLRGRLFSQADVDGARRVVVINDAFARKYFGIEDPVGQEIKFKTLDQIPTLRDASFQVIGVVSNERNSGLRNPPAPEAYLPYTLLPYTILHNAGGILVRTAVNPDSLITAIRRQLWAIDSDLAVTNTSTVESSLERDVFSSPRFEFIFAGVFAAVGLLLVMTGIFSVMAYSVSLRLHEIGIRMALGARRGDIFEMVIRKGMVLLGAGIALGALASFGLTRYLANQLWGVKPTDPLTFAAVVALIIIAGLVACFVPARRATRVDPIITLRQE